MMEAAKSAQEDLRQIMDEVRAQTAAKSALRELLSKVRRDVAANLGKRNHGRLDFSHGLGSEADYHHAPIPFSDTEEKGRVRFVPTDLYAGRLQSVAQLQAVKKDLQDQLDSMSELTELASLRLQMVMDRRSRYMETLSNIMKKISDTEQSITRNLK